jgi:transposase
VPFTNNLAEQAMRMPKVKQRISGSYRSLAGAQSACSLRSHLERARKQGIRMFEALRQALSGSSVAFG